MPDYQSAFNSALSGLDNSVNIPSYTPMPLSGFQAPIPIPISGNNWNMTPNDFNINAAPSMNPQSATNGGSSSGVIDQLWNNYIKPVGEGLLGDIGNLTFSTPGMMAADVVNSTKNADPNAGFWGNFAQGAENSLGDLYNIFAHPADNLQQQRISQAMGESPDLAQQWYAPSRLTNMALGSISPLAIGGAAKSFNELMAPTTGFSSDLVNQLPKTQNIQADFGKWPTVGDARETSLSQQPFNVLSQAPQINNDFGSLSRIWNSPQFDFSVPKSTTLQDSALGADLGKSPFWENNISNADANLGEMPNFGSVLRPSNVKFPQFTPQPIQTKSMSVLDNLFNLAKQNGLPPGREYEYLQSLYPSVADKTGTSFDELLNSIKDPNSIIQNAPRANAYGVTSQDAIRNLLKYEPVPIRSGEANLGEMPNFANEASKGETVPEGLSPSQSLLYTVRNGSKATPEAYQQAMTTLKNAWNLPESQLRSLGDQVAMDFHVQNSLNIPEELLQSGTTSNPLAKSVFDEMKPSIVSQLKTSANPFVRSNEGIMNEVNSGAKEAAPSIAEELPKSELTMETPNNSTLKMPKSNFAADIPLVGRLADGLKSKFSLSGTLGDHAQDYYNYLSTRDYRTGQASQDIMKTFGRYSPEDLKQFRLDRDGGKIGPGHKFEALNKAYDELLNKYTGQDVTSGLERGNLKNYVPRIMDVDKNNLQSVKRSMGSDSLGRFAEDRTDTRTLRQIMHDEGHDPYKKDMYEITLARLQSSINAQEAREFINRMINDKQAIKFENPHKAFTSKQYDKKTTGVYVDPITKEAYLMPKQIADFLNKERDYSDLKNYLGGLDSFNAIARRLSIVNPAVHFWHNILTSIPYALNESGASGLHVLNPSFWAKGMKKAREANPALIDEMERMGVLKPDYMPIGENAPKDLAHEAQTQDMSKFGKWVSDLKHQSTTGSPFERLYDTTSTLMRPVDSLTWGPEHAARVAVYSTAKDMGATPEEATAILNRNFGTNTKTLTPFEKNVMTRAFTFYPWLKHIFTWGARNTINAVKNPIKNPYPWLTAGALDGTNYALSGHNMWDNPEGHKLQVDSGNKDEKGNEKFVDPYLPLLEFAKAFQDRGKFFYNRMNQGITTPTNLIANLQYGPFSPSSKPIVDQSQVDAGLQDPWNERFNYVRDRLTSGPTETLEPKSLIDALGAHTSTYNQKAIDGAMKSREMEAARAMAKNNKKNGIPVSAVLKKQESGKAPFQIQQ